MPVYTYSTIDDPSAANFGTFPSGINQGGRSSAAVAPTPPSMTHWLSQAHSKAPMHRALMTPARSSAFSLTAAGTTASF
jgi:hypothetical protein